MKLIITYKFFQVNPPYIHKHSISRQLTYKDELGNKNTIFSSWREGDDTILYTSYNQLSDYVYFFYFLHEFYINLIFTLLISDFFIYTNSVRRQEKILTQKKKH